MEGFESLPSILGGFKLLQRRSAMARELKEVTTKTGYKIKESWCRKCSSMRPASDFYNAMDLGFVDTNGLLSVCKSCINNMYSDLHSKTNSMEQSIHRLCIALNVRYSNDAMSATKTQVQTMIDAGKNVNAIFGIYCSKLIATNKSIDKSIQLDNSYEDVGVIFTSEDINTPDIAIPQEVIERWGDEWSREEIKFLESEYVKFGKSYNTEDHAQVSLLKQVCYTLLELKNARIANDDTKDLTKSLQDIMKSLKIAPSSKGKDGEGSDTELLGLWIKDIETKEPAQWLKTDPRGDMYRDVADVEGYFQKFIVRPIKNFITQSKDFNIEDDDDDFYDLDGDEFAHIDDDDMDETDDNKTIS